MAKNSCVLIVIDTENSVFEDDFKGEVGRILMDLIGKLPDSGDQEEEISLRDINGNVVGKARVLSDKRRA